MPPQYVRPYVKTNKRDAADAEACCEAVQRPGMRFVPVKREDQRSALMLHRVREQLLKQRTATVNAVRAYLAEPGSRRAAAEGPAGPAGGGRRPRGPAAAAARPRAAPGPGGAPAALEERLEALDRRLVAAARDGGACERLVAVPGRRLRMDADNRGAEYATLEVRAVGHGRELPLLRAPRGLARSVARRWSTCPTWAAGCATARRCG